MLRRGGFGTMSEAWGPGRREIGHAGNASKRLMVTGTGCGSKDQEQKGFRSPEFRCLFAPAVAWPGLEWAPGAGRLSKSDATGSRHGRRGPAFP